MLQWQYLLDLETWSVMVRLAIICFVEFRAGRYTGNAVDIDVPSIAAIKLRLPRARRIKASFFERVNVIAFLAPASEISFSLMSSVLMFSSLSFCVLVDSIIAGCRIGVSGGL